MTIIDPAWFQGKWWKWSYCLVAESTLRPGDEGYKISWQSNLLTIITLEFSLSNVGNRENIVTRALFMIVASNVGTKLTFRPKEKHAIQFSTKMQHFICLWENMPRIVNAMYMYIYLATRI